MKSINVMSIIGIILASYSFFCILYLLGIRDVENAAGWGIINSAYLLAFSITARASIKNNIQ